MYTNRLPLRYVSMNIAAGGLNLSNLKASLVLISFMGAYWLLLRQHRMLTRMLSGANYKMLLLVLAYSGRGLQR